MLNIYLFHWLNTSPVLHITGGCILPRTVTASRVQLKPPALLSRADECKRDRSEWRINKLASSLKGVRISRWCRKWGRGPFQKADQAFKRRRKWRLHLSWCPKQNILAFDLRPIPPVLWCTLLHSSHKAEEQGVWGVVFYLLGGDEKQLLGRLLFSALSSSYPTLSFSKTRLFFNCLPPSPASWCAPVSLPQDKGLEDH